MTNTTYQELAAEAITNVWSTKPVIIKIRTNRATCTSRTANHARTTHRNKEYEQGFHREAFSILFTSRVGFFRLYQQHWFEASRYVPGGAIPM